MHHGRSNMPSGSRAVGTKVSCSLAVGSGGRQPQALRSPQVTCASLMATVLDRCKPKGVSSRVRNGCTRPTHFMLAVSAAPQTDDVPRVRGSMPVWSICAMFILCRPPSCRAASRTIASTVRIGWYIHIKSGTDVRRTV